MHTEEVLNSYNCIVKSRALKFKDPANSRNALLLHPLKHLPRLLLESVKLMMQISMT